MCNEQVGGERPVGRKLFHAPALLRRNPNRLRLIAVRKQLTVLCFISVHKSATLEV